MPHVLVAGRIHEAGRTLLRDASDVTVDFVDEVSTVSYAPFVKRADAILIRTQPMPASVIAEAPGLRIVSRHGVGYDAVELEALNARGIPLTIIGDVNSSAVAEHTLMLMLALSKRVLIYDKATREGGWDRRNTFEATELLDKTLLLIGFGRIGRKVARLAAAFGMRVMAYDAFTSVESVRDGGATPVTDLGSALPIADIVSVHVPLTPGKPEIGAPELARMKPSAIVINTARGGLVDEAALSEALADGRLAGAGLDVFADEPPTTDHPLFGCDRVILTPHSAGLTGECAGRMSVAAVRNILDFFEGTLDPALIVNREYVPAFGP